MFCPMCGLNLPPEVKFCPECGTNIKDYNSKLERENPGATEKRAVRRSYKRWGTQIIEPLSPLLDGAYDASPKNADYPGRNVKLQGSPAYNVPAIIIGTIMLLIGLYFTYGCLNVSPAIQQAIFSSIISIGVTILGVMMLILFYKNTD